MTRILICWGASVNEQLPMQIGSAYNPTWETEMEVVELTLYVQATSE